jgi:biopolymer transport protein ExbD
VAGRLDDGEDLVEMHDINMTPFIDVMLVLLIIFMVAAPLATVDVPVELPAASQEAPPRPDKPIFLTLRTDNSVSLADEPVAPDALGAALDKESGGDHTQRLFLRADKNVSYGALMLFMEKLRHAGYLKVGLVALQSDPAP